MESHESNQAIRLQQLSLGVTFPLVTLVSLIQSFTLAVSHLTGKGHGWSIPQVDVDAAVAPGAATVQYCVFPLLVSDCSKKSSTVLVP